MFLTGQKIVCIDDKFSLAVGKFYTALPKEGVTYTVRGTAPGVETNHAPTIAVYLAELRNPRSNTPPYRERGFKPERFRPLEELSTEEIINAGQPEREMEPAQI